MKGIIKRDADWYKEQNFGRMAAFYGVCPKTFRKYLKPFRDELDDIVGQKRYGALIRSQVELILARLGEP